MYLAKRTLTAIASLIACLLIFSASYSQNKKMDSLRAIYDSSHDTAKVQILCQFAKFYTANNPDTGEVLSAKALQMAKKMSYEYGMALSYNILGYAQTTKSKFDESIGNLLKGLD